MLCGRGRLRGRLLRLGRDEGVDAEDAEGDDGHREQALDHAARLAHGGVGVELVEDGDGRAGALLGLAAGHVGRLPLGTHGRAPADDRAGARTADRRRGQVVLRRVELVVDRVADGRHLLTAAARHSALGDRGRAGRGGHDVDVVAAGGLRPVAVGRGRRSPRTSSGAAPEARSPRSGNRRTRWGRWTPAPTRRPHRCGWGGRRAGADPPVRSCWLSTAAAGNASSTRRSMRGSGDGTAANGAALVRGPTGGRDAAGRAAAGTGGSGSRERETWRAPSDAREAAGRRRAPGGATGVRRPLVTPGGRMIAHPCWSTPPQTLGDVRTPTIRGDRGLAPVAPVTV